MKTGVQYKCFPTNTELSFRLLGVDKLFSYAINEWLNDIKKNQLPGLLGGVGPIHSLVQLGECNKCSQLRGFLCFLICVRHSNSLFVQ